jgi:hypothetical protein
MELLEGGMFKLHGLLAEYVRVGSGCIIISNLSDLFNQVSLINSIQKQRQRSLPVPCLGISMMRTIICQGPPSEDPSRHSIIGFTSSAHADCATLTGSGTRRSQSLMTMSVDDAWAWRKAGATRNRHPFSQQDSP